MDKKPKQFLSDAIKFRSLQNATRAKKVSKSIFQNKVNY
jgi:hypothetical protein